MGYSHTPVRAADFNIIENEREEESRRKNKEDMVKSVRQIEALVMTRGRSTERGSSGSQSHDRYQSKKHLKCHHCGKRGHVKKDCWHLKNGGKNSTSQGCVANTSEDGDVLVSEAIISSNGGRQLHDRWILDSGGYWIQVQLGT